ncbi:dipeptidase [Oceanomicrobium pacificus]|uniref:Dipeptidase n=1 Tax=Oceanomicrobium pacificus TaxID=2692916 RepID=A0A6B0TNW5_9RHOB|nr:dipeptidase [Oceanomicrobium pacificus]MXU66300.1 dipeptidase [Oceanomicrobium pacificus]
MSHLDAVLAHIDADRDNAVARLFDLLRIESISTDPAYKDACRAAADWLVDDLASIGFEASRRDTPGHPMVVGHGGAEDGKALLFYGHYDVQPVDPLDLWDSAPFDPRIDETPDGPVIRARGASDDKGQLMTFIEACRAWKAVTGSLPARVSILFEGEEESGSPSLVPFLTDNADELKADIALVCDTGMWDKDTPAISTMLRGMVGEELTITGPSKDLHSGMFGGPARNPIRVLTRILADMHDETGRVTLPGFYDGVPDLSDEIKAQWDSLDFDADAFLGAVGLSVPAGEEGYSALEQIWARPTFEVNGIWGGYTGAGFKTVLPSEASAKVTFRLVGDQDPNAIQAAFKSYVESALPADCSVAWKSKDCSPATTMPVDAPEFALARDALSDEWPNPAVFVGSGGSIPIVGHFRRILGMDSVLIGFGLDDDQIHSPNEKYSLTSFTKGIRSWARVLDALSRA